MVHDSGCVPSDVGGDQVDVGQQHRLELAVLLPGEVVAGEDLVEVGVEVADRLVEQPLVVEHGGDVGGERLDVGVGEDAAVTSPQPVEDVGELVHCLTEELAGDFAGAVAGGHDLLGVAVDPSAELGGVESAAALVEVADGGGVGVADAADEVAPLLQPFAAGVDLFFGQRDPGFDELGCGFGGGEVGEQRAGEQPHDRPVLLGER